jgi:hypothetical protein
MKLNWISVDEKLPEDGQEVLIHSMGYVQGTYQPNIGSLRWVKNEGAKEVYRITHWIPVEDAKDAIEETKEIKHA